MGVHIIALLWIASLVVGIIAKAPALLWPLCDPVQQDMLVRNIAACIPPTPQHVFV